MRNVATRRPSAARAGASRLPIGPQLDAAKADEVIGAVTSFAGGTRLQLVV
jgi:hypothetical protein